MTPEPPEEHESRPVLSSPGWSWLLAIAVLAGIVALSVTLLRGGTGGERGARGLQRGTEIPPFAAPLVASNLDGDVNLARRRDSGPAGTVPACSIRSPDVVTSCALLDKGLVILAFATLDDECVRGFDTLAASLRRLPVRASVVGVAIRGDRDRWRSLAPRWPFPVVYDRDGGLATAFSIQVCPQTTFVTAAGRVAGTVVGSVTADALRRQATAALRGAAGP